MAEALQYRSGLEDRQVALMGQAGLPLLAP